MSTHDRWRLILGRYAEAQLPLNSQDQDADMALGYLYDRQYQARGHRMGSGETSKKRGLRGGSLDPSAVTAISWLDSARKLFPQSTFERMSRDALTKYGVSELLLDPSAIEAIAPDSRLAAAMLRMKGSMNPEMAQGLRVLIRKVVDDIVEHLRPKFATSLSGARLRHRRSFHASSQNFDWRRTIAANLKNVDGESGKMLIDDVRFMSRQKRKNLDWEVIVLVDQSGSMTESLLHASVSAAILAGLPGVSVRLVLFDTAIVDMSHLAHDPVEVLMTSQLGGGTDIARAMAFAQGLVTQPTRTVVALISDFDEGGSLSRLLSVTGSLASSGVTLLGLAALDGSGEPWFNEAVAGKLQACGMDIAAMTPDRFAEWLGEVMG